MNLLKMIQSDNKTDKELKIEKTIELEDELRSQFIMIFELDIFDHKIFYY